MTQVNDEDVPNDVVVTSQSLTVETTNTQRQLMTGAQLPTLPFDLLSEILCRLPVKLLVQLRCLCKFLNSLISDSMFAKKHLQLSTKRHHLMISSGWSSRDLVLHHSPIPSVLSTSTVVIQTQLYLPSTFPIPRNYVSVVCSCNGIFCCIHKAGYYFLWNPSIRKFKLLPPVEYPRKGFAISISFGYDHFIDNYKVIVVSSKGEVCVNTLGTNYWRIIGDIPNDYNISYSGIFVSGTVNWFQSDNSSILSLNLDKESYQELLLPDYENENDQWTLGMVRDCLCVFGRGDLFLDVWIMKEYGNEESWTKLYGVPNMQDQGLEACTVLYISEDDQLLLEFKQTRDHKMKLVVYDSKTGTLNILEFQNNYYQRDTIVYIESLISP